MVQGPAVLIIDDSATSCHVMETILQPKGYQIKSVRDGREGLMTVLRELPHCVVLDVVLPGMSGFEVCRNIRANEHLRGVPIIMVSTKSTALDKAWALRQGATHYLVKPFEDEVFAKIVNEAIVNYTPPASHAAMRQARYEHTSRQVTSADRHVAAPSELSPLEYSQTQTRMSAYRSHVAKPYTPYRDSAPPHPSPLHKLVPLRNQGEEAIGGGSSHFLLTCDEYIRKLYEAIDGQSDIEALCAVTQLRWDVVVRGLRSLLAQHCIRLREPNGNLISS